MANWKKLNKEFDDLIDNMTAEDWKNWNLKREKRMLQNQAETYAKSISKNETYQRYLSDAFMAGVESARSWQPIDIAPKDGTKILVYGKPWSESLIGQYHVRDKYWMGLNLMPFHYPPSHWMPLPELP